MCVCVCGGGGGGGSRTLAHVEDGWDGVRWENNKQS